MDSLNAMTSPVEVSVVMPCLNEALTVGTCIEKALRCLTELGVKGEVVIADNGSTDGSVELAQRAGARVVHAPRKGYGAALKTGIAAAHGKYIIMGDCDDSYDFLALGPFIERLREGFDLVVGNRFHGGIAPRAMPLSHRYFGNPLLTLIGRTLFRTKEVGDFYCGLRGFRRDTIRRLKLQSDGMEFALEMIVRASMYDCRITQVPTTLSPDGRDREPHLRRFRDGWRSLRFYFLMAPRWLFGIPGTILLFAGAAVTLRLLLGPWTLAGVTFDYHTLLYSVAAIILGYQSLLLYMFAKLMASYSGLHPSRTRLEPLNGRGSLVLFFTLGLICILVGIVLGLVATSFWYQTRFGVLEPDRVLRIVVLSVLALIVGGQTMMAGFYFGLYNLIGERRQNTLHEDSATLAPGAEGTATAAEPINGRL